MLSTSAKEFKSKKKNLCLGWISVTRMHPVPSMCIIMSDKQWQLRFCLLIVTLDIPVLFNNITLINFCSSFILSAKRFYHSDYLLRVQYLLTCEDIYFLFFFCYGHSSLSISDSLNIYLLVNLLIISVSVFCYCNKQRFPVVVIVCKNGQLFLVWIICKVFQTLPFLPLLFVNDKWNDSSHDCNVPSVKARGLSRCYVYVGKVTNIICICLRNLGSVELTFHSALTYPVDI